MYIHTYVRRVSCVYTYDSTAIWEVCIKHVSPPYMAYLSLLDTWNGGLTLHTIPDDCQRRAGTHKVITSPHAKRRPRHDGEADVVDTRVATVEEHGHTADGLTDEDHQDGLPPIEADAHHGAAQRPVAKRQADVKGDVVEPAPGALLGRRGIQVFVAPRRTAAGVAMLVERRVLGLRVGFEGAEAGEGVFEVGRLRGGARLELSDAHGWLWWFGSVRGPGGSVGSFRRRTTRAAGSTTSRNGAVEEAEAS